MADGPLPAGKLPAVLLRALLESASPLPEEVRVASTMGEDACVIQVEGGALVPSTSLHAEIRP